MRRVEGLHFIVTKADTLAGGPSQAREVVHGILNRGARESLVESCREYGINASDESELDDVRVYFHSASDASMWATYTHTIRQTPMFCSMLSATIRRMSARVRFCASYANL